MQQTPYKIHYAPIDLGEDDIKEIEFESFSDLIIYLSDELYAKYNNKNDLIIREPIAYLVSHKEEVYVTEDLDCLIAFITFIGSMPIGKVSSTDVFIQEYESFEDAYEVALSMQEISPICYREK